MGRRWELDHRYRFYFQMWVASIICADVDHHAIYLRVGCDHISNFVCSVKALWRLMGMFWGGDLRCSLVS